MLIQNSQEEESRITTNEKGWGKKVTGRELGL